MAFPTIQTADTKNGTQASNSTAWTLTYPTNIASGDLLVACVATDGDNCGIPNTWPSGWQEYRGANVGAVSILVAVKNAAGTETGTFTVTLTNTEQGGWRIFRITGAMIDTLPVGSSVSLGAAGGGVQGNSVSGLCTALGLSANPDPPNLDPANWATEDTLWFAICALDTSRTISVYPYASNNSADVSGGSTGATLGVCTTTSTVSSLDPGTFTISASDDWQAVTFAVRPSSPPTSIPRASAVDAGNAMLSKAWQATRRWRHGTHGILLPETSFVH